MRLYIPLFLLIALFLAACSTQGEPPGTPKDEPCDDISLRFQILTTVPGTGTRADTDHNETDSEYRQFEDGIDFSNLCLFVFVRKASAVDDDEKLIFKTNDFSSANDTMVYINGTYGLYDVDMTIPKQQLGRIIFGEDSEEMLDPNSTENVVFRILLVANAFASSETEEERKAKWEEVDGTIFKEVIDQLERWSCPMSAIYNAGYAGDDLTGFYTMDPMPMFGTNMSVVSQRELYYSRPENRVNLEDIDMLRSLAKVRVIDNITGKNEEGYPRVESVRFIGSQTDVMVLPAGAVNYVNGKQVHAPRIAEPDKVLNMLDAPVYKLGVVPAGLTGIPAEERKGAVMMAYVPEQEIGPVNNDVAGEGMPVFRITVNFGTGLTNEYDIPMTHYGENNFHFGNNILRNHVYTLSVDAAAFADANIVVSPWTPEYLEIDFSENFAMAEDGALAFVNGTYAFLEPQTGRLVLNDYPQAVTGSFGISEPEGARWEASLVTIGGELNVIQFVTGTGADGKLQYSNRISGIIDGQKVTFYVGATQSASNVPRMALLQVMVTLQSGLTIPVTILKSSDSEYGDDIKNITFIQNPQ